MSYNVTPQWLAGFIDGEGCFNSTRTRTTILPRLIIVNTNLEILKAIKEKYGGDIHSRDLKESWKTSNSYRVSYKNFRNLMNEVLPHLQIKKEVATLSLSMFDTKDMSKRLEIKEKMNFLNKKGK